MSDRKLPTIEERNAYLRERWGGVLYRLGEPPGGTWEVRVPTFAEALKEARLTAGLTRQQLAAQSGWSHRWVEELERGNTPTIQQARDLGAVLGVDLRVAAARARGRLAVSVEGMSDAQILEAIEGGAE